ncbi:MAG: hypothetical protein K0S74_789 [Chlamydiales bacterium]|jgi:RimJ/RimL family protein N-acetyltransferase|nr:hypothetical protein [Chlamydiales bacterium]
MNFEFGKALLKHKEIIFKWLDEPHMREFWDNSQEHRDDIVNFMEGRKESSTYFNGDFTYWIGSIDNQPFCFLMTAKVDCTDGYPLIWKEYLSNTGHTYSIDFGIGNKNFIGKGLAAPVLTSFIDFFRFQIDSKADTFFIDPDEKNPRAQHVYTKAGFQLVGDFIPEKGVFSGQKTCLMVKIFLPKFNGNSHVL